MKFLKSPRQIGGGFFVLAASLNVMSVREWAVWHLKYANLVIVEDLFRELN